MAMTDHIHRRNFLKNSATLGAALAGMPVANALGIESAPARDKVRIGIIGVGGRGNSLMGNLLAMKDVEIRAIGDIFPAKARAAQQRVVKAGTAQPDIYAGDEQIWKKLVDRDDLDAIIIASYWKWHTPMAVYAMNHGLYVGVEVPCAITLDG
jgi:predicted dehydrogenase